MTVRGPDLALTGNQGRDPLVAPCVGQCQTQDAVTKEALEAALRAAQAGDSAALVTIVSTQGSTPLKAGAQMLVYEDGRIVGTIGGGCLEAEMARRARYALTTGRTQLADYDLTADQAADDGLVCGGRMQVFIEPILATPTLCLFGAGHVARPLARMAKMAGFRVEVGDDRAAFANEERFPAADRIIVDEIPALAGQFTLGPNSYVVIVTRGHKGDADALESVVGRELGYVGLLGSRVKFVHLAAAIEKRGVAPDAIGKVHCPAGLAIGAESADEIAVSILAEMIAIRRRVDPLAARSMKMDLPGRLGAQRPGGPERGDHAPKDATDS